MIQRVSQRMNAKSNVVHKQKNDLKDEMVRREGVRERERVREKERGYKRT